MGRRIRRYVGKWGAVTQESQQDTKGVVLPRDQKIIQICTCICFVFLYLLVAVLWAEWAAFFFFFLFTIATDCEVVYCERLRLT